MGNKKQIKWGIFLQYGQMFISVAISLFYTPMALNILGQAEYGLYNLSSSIISYLTLLSLGFGSSYIRFYSKFKAKEKEDDIAKLNWLYLLTFLIMGCISFIFGFIISNNVKLFFNESYTLEEMKIAKKLMMLLTINLSLSFPMSLFNAYIVSQEKFIFQKTISIITTIIGPCLNICALLLGYGSVGMVALTTLLTLILNIFNIVYCLKKLKFRVKFGKVQNGLFKEIFIFSFFIAINQIIDQINWQTDKIILGKMINASAVAIYAIASTINNYYVCFSTAITDVFVPEINRIENEEIVDKDKKLTDIFIKVGRLQWIVLSLVLTGFIFFGKIFIIKWAGPDYEMSYYIILLLIAPVTIPLLQSVGVDIQRAKNMHKFRSLVYLAMAIINVFVSIVLCKFYGIIGVTLGTTISLVVANGFIMNIYYHKKLRINVLKFWKEILKMIPGLLIPVVFGVVVLMYYRYSNIIEYICLIIIYVIIFAFSMYNFALNKQEKGFVKQKFIKSKGRIL